MVSELLGQRELHEVDWLHEGETGARQAQLEDRLREVMDVLRHKLLGYLRGLRLGARGRLGWNRRDEHDVGCTKVREQLEVGGVMRGHDQVAGVTVNDGR